MLRIHVTRKELNKPGSVPWKTYGGSPCRSIPLARVRLRNTAGLTGGTREVSAGWESGLGVQLSLGYALSDAASCGKTQFSLVCDITTPPVLGRVRTRKYNGTKNLCLWSLSAFPTCPSQPRQRQRSEWLQKNQQNLSGLH